MSIRKERARIFASTKILALSLRIAHRPKEEEVVEAEQPVLALQVGSETKEITLRSLTWLKGVMSEYQEEIASFANFPSLFMGLVNDVNELEHYDGYCRIVASDGRVVADRLDPLQYQTFIEEKIENWTYLKSTFYKPFGEQEGVYRVGPLARLLVSERCGTPEADREREEFLARYGEACTSSFFWP